jgi:hypothetical protein
VLTIYLSLSLSFYVSLFMSDSASQLQERGVLEISEGASFLDVVYGSIQRVWFDYDSVLLAPEDGW